MAARATPRPTLAPGGGKIIVNVYDGTRQLMAPGQDVLLTVRDGFQKQARYTRPSPSIDLEDLAIYGNSGDNYAVIAFVDGYRQAGFFPIPVSAGVHQVLNLMLLPKNGSFKFADAKWPDIRRKMPGLAALIENDVDSDPGRFYDDLRENRSADAACLLNLATVMGQVFLPRGTLIDYLKAIKSDDLHSDRIFAWARPALIEQIRQAVFHGQFEQESSADLALHSSLEHGPATCSFKQIQFGEANLQLTFHEESTREIAGETCILVEPDIDYYKDLGAHALLEVLPNALTRNISDPMMVYMLRWIAGQRAGIPEFDPLYTIQ